MKEQAYSVSFFTILFIIITLHLRHTYSSNHTLESLNIIINVFLASDDFCRLPIDFV